MSVAGPAVAATGPRRLSGKLAVLALAVALAFVLGGYLFTLPAPWLRTFGAEIAYRAEADPNPPIPEDSRQELRREAVDNRLICMANITSWPWDTMVVVPSGQTLTTHAVLGEAVWRDGDLTKTDALLAADDRYQLIVFLNGTVVVDHQLFFTFWGDLSALARAEGYGPATAIFTAASRGGRYIVHPAEGVVAADCPPKTEVRR